MEYQIMFYGGMAGALVALILAIFLYIKLNIPKVVKDLTGIRLPSLGRFASRQHYADSEQTGRITNEIKLRKYVDVAKAERTNTMKNEQTRNTAATHPLGGDISLASLSGAISTGPTKAAKRPGAGGTTLLEEVGKPQPAVGNTARQNSGMPAGPAETTLLGETLKAQPGAAETTVLGETSNLQPAAAETTLLGEELNVEPAAAETTLLGETPNVEPVAAETTLLGEELNVEPAAAETTLLGETPSVEPAAAETTLLEEAPSVKPAAAETTLLGEAPNVEPAAAETTLLGETPSVVPAAAETTLLGEVPSVKQAVAETTLLGEAPSVTPAAAETTLLGDMPDVAQAAAQRLLRTSAEAAFESAASEKQLVKAGAHPGGAAAAAYTPSGSSPAWGAPAEQPQHFANRFHAGSAAETFREAEPMHQEHQERENFFEETSALDEHDPAETTLLGIEEPEGERHFRKEVDIMIVHTKMTI